VFIALSTFRARTCPTGTQIFPWNKRISDLLARMTLEEKVAQMGVHGKANSFTRLQDLFVDDKGVFLPDHAELLLKNGLGEMFRPSENRSPRAMAEFTNTMQRWLKEHHTPGNLFFTMKNVCTATSHRRALLSIADRLASPGDPSLVFDIFTATAGGGSGSRRTTVSDTSTSTLPATRAGDAQKKPMAKTRIWSRAWAWRPFRDFRGPAH